MKKKKVDSYEGNVKDEYNVEKSRSLKSCKATLQKKKTYHKNQKSNFFFTDRSDDIDSYSHGDQTDTVKLMIKVGLSPSKKNLFYLPLWKPFKNDGKGFLFHLKSPFRSVDISVFVMTFLSCRKRRFH